MIFHWMKTTIRHWQKIIVALSETDRLMQEIDEITFLPIKARE